jgi:hypothetical protein
VLLGFVVGVASAWCKWRVKRQEFLDRDGLLQPLRDSILTRSRATAAQSCDDSGFRPVAVKEEPVELPMPAGNGRRSSSEPFSAKGRGVSWSLGAPLCQVVY